MGRFWSWMVIGIAQSDRIGLGWMGWGCFVSPPAGRRGGVKKPRVGCALWAIDQSELTAVPTYSCFSDEIVLREPWLISAQHDLVTKLNESDTIAAECKDFIDVFDASRMKVYRKGIFVFILNFQF